MGSIRIFYTTQTVSGMSAATAGQDFTTATAYVDLAQGDNLAAIQIVTLEDPAGIPERDEIFYLSITSVRALSTSRSGELKFIPYFWHRSLRLSLF